MCFWRNGPHKMCPKELISAQHPLDYPSLHLYVYFIILLWAFRGTVHIKCVEENFYRLNIHWIIFLFIYVSILFDLSVCFFCTIDLIYPPIHSFYDNSSSPISFLRLIHSVKNFVPQAYVRLFLVGYQLVKDRSYFPRKHNFCLSHGQRRILFRISRYTCRNCCNTASVDPSLDF